MPGGLTVNFNVLNQMATPVLYADTLTNRPTASIIGRVFFRTDTPFGIYRDNGTSWDLIANPDTNSVTGSGATGQVTFFTSSNVISGNNNLFWDSTNNRLGIGTTTPGVPLDVHGTGTNIQMNGTGTNNAFAVFQNAGVGKWRIGNNYSTGTNYFSIYDSVNAVESFKIDAAASRSQFTFVGDQSVQGDIIISRSGFAPRLLVTTASSAAGLQPQTTVSTATGFFSFFKFTAATTTLKIINANDAALYNSTSSGDIAIMNDFATGKTKFGNGGSATAQITFTAAGRLLIGTTTEGTDILLVNGTAKINNTITASSFIKTSALATDILAGDGSVITAGTNITISAGQINANVDNATTNLQIAEAAHEFQDIIPVSA